MFYVSNDKHLNYEQSKEFLELCFQEATYFTLLDMAFRRYDNYNQDLEKCLEPFKVGEITNRNGEYGNSMYLDETLTSYVYEITEQSKESFLSVFPGIYMDWEADFHQVDREMPEISSLSDIIFLDEEKRMIVETIEHEGIIRIFQKTGALVDWAQQKKKIWKPFSHEIEKVMSW
ncbi:MAG: hypothetical protein E7277_09395 [Lachnospiraceae bacterium]|nr:hypothetical protein [Lachnospiraceae bacterium]